MFDIFQTAGLPPPAVLDTPDALRILVTGLRPRHPSAPRGAQARDVLEQMEDVLRPHGCDFSHVARTWFFLENILDWYGEFNAARTAFFRERHVFGGLVPASTGVGIAENMGLPFRYSSAQTSRGAPSAMISPASSTTARSA